jgi:hypothetical protein
LFEGDLNAGDGDGSGGFGHSPATPAGCREEPDGIAVSFPEIPEDLKSSEGQRNVSVLVSLPSMDVNEHSFGIDIGNLEVGSFLKPETEGVHDGETGFVMRELDRIKKFSDFVEAQDHGQGFLFFGSDECEGGPFSLECVGEEELDAAQ